MHGIPVPAGPVRLHNQPPQPDLDTGKDIVKHIPRVCRAQLDTIGIAGIPGQLVQTRDYCPSVPMPFPVKNADATCPTGGDRQPGVIVSHRGVYQKPKNRHAKIPFLLSKRMGSGLFGVMCETYFRITPAEKNIGNKRQNFDKMPIIMQKTSEKLNQTGC
ncbi:MAG: hypothetical protein RKO24_13100 [Candidatus Competibacter sp.]|nr:hypothetical protein [Candidatus Competibacter sp.]